MRRALLAALDQPDTGGLEMSPIVKEALLANRVQLTPAAASAA
jgi:formate dehydrogenase subunit delta